MRHLGGKACAFTRVHKNKKSRYRRDLADLCVEAVRARYNLGFPCISSTDKSFSRKLFNPETISPSYSM